MIQILKKISRVIPVLLICGAGLTLSSCFNDDDDPLAEQYAEWKAQNEQYLVDAQSLKDENGEPYYIKIIPDWAPDAYVLMHWHNDRSLTENNLSPIDNSITQITYDLYNVEGEQVSNSFSNRDSVYTSRPSDNIIGMWVGLTNMHIGDSVTMVIPSQAGYGIRNYGDIKPYSTLVYGVKLKGIPAYEVR